MLLGDTHGNTNFIVNRVIPEAYDSNCSWIYQVGDFGYWEHTPEGVDFLYDVNSKLIEKNIKLVFIQGNHDKVSLIPEKYSQAENGFFWVRSNIAFAPNGVVWSPNAGKSNFIALGGAYSIDKKWRLANETTPESLWFPEEEMTDVQFDKIVNSITQKIDVMLTHDKPSMSNPNVKLLSIAECIPNQQRIQKAVNVLQPRLLVHGHLHSRYTDMIRCGNDGAATRVEGLGADVSQSHFDAWTLISIED